MTEPRDDDYEPVPGAETLPEDVRNGEITNPDETDPGLADPAEDDK